MAISEWKPASVEEVKRIVKKDLARFDAKQRAVFQQYKVEPYTASIVRYGNPETVVIVAQRGNEVIYWEDVEQGFNLSRITDKGLILEHWCNQDDLGLALNSWIEERPRPKVGPASSI